MVLALSFLESFALMMDFTVLYTMIVYLWKLPLYKVILFSFTVSIPSIVISPFAGRLVDAKGSIICIQYSKIIAVIFLLYLTLNIGYINFMEAIRLVKKSAIFRVVLALSFLESFALMMDFTVLYTMIVYLWKLPLYKVILFSFTVSIPSIVISPFAGRLVDAKGSIICIQYSSIFCFF